MAILWRVGNWHKARPELSESQEFTRVEGQSVREFDATGHVTDEPRHATPPRHVGWPLAILAALIFSKYFYLASLTSYYTFFLITRFHVSVRTAQIDLFIFLGAVAAGTVLGGPIGDRFGRKWVIWGSIFGVVPFTLALPYANLFWTPILTVMIGLISPPPSPPSSSTRRNWCPAASG